MKHAEDRHPHGGEHPKPEKPRTAKREAAGEDPAPAPDFASTIAELERKLVAGEEEYKEIVDQLQRVAAEYSNYQKRMQRVLQDEKKQAVRSLVLDLLPAMDNFERALAHAKDATNLQAVIDGIRASHDQLVAALAKHGVKQIAAAGQSFDPERHEAVACLPSETQPQGTVIEEYAKGYQLDGQTIRASRVAVSDGPAKPAEPGETGDGEVQDDHQPI
jgi:molecular chaperone GrpE